MTILFHVIAFSNMLMLYVIIYYPLKKSKSFSKISDTELSVSRREQSVTHTMTMTITDNHSARPRKDKDKDPELKRIKLDHVLKNKFGYDAFIQHLSKEFSMENLLSMTEFLQFKYYVHRKAEKSVMNKDLRRWFNMLPLDSLPRSEIVYAGEEEEMKSNGKRKKKSTFIIELVKQKSLSSTTKSSQDKPEPPENPAANNNNDNKKELELEDDLPQIVYDKSSNKYKSDDEEFVKDIKQKAHKLYVKYIRTSSEYEINISYELRLSYKTLLDNQVIWLENKEFNDLIKLRDMFDNCCIIMKRLINHSFTRFRNSKYFDKIENEIRGSNKGRL